MEIGDTMVYPHFFGVKMKFTVNKKHNVPMKVKELSEHGYNVYVTLDMNKLKHITKHFLYETRQKIKHEAFVDYYILSDIISKYTNMMQCSGSTPDPLNELFNLMELVDERHKDNIKKYSEHTLNDTSIVDRLFGDEDFDCDPYHTMCSNRINNEISNFVLKDEEIEWFNSKLETTSFASKSWGLTVSLLHNSNILTLLNMYRDDTMIMPTRKPYESESSYTGYALHNPNNESSYIAFDGLCIGFKSLEVAELFVNKLHILNMNDTITIHVMNPLSVKIKDALSKKQYGVFLSTRTNPIKDNIGFITLTHEQLIVNTDADYVGVIDHNESTKVVKDYIESSFDKIQKICDRYSVNDPILELSSRPGWINRGNSLSEHVMHRKITRDLGRTACMVSSNQFTTDVERRLTRYLMNAYSRSRYNLHSIGFLIHIPIKVDTDIKSFSKLMNYLTLTQVINLSETTLMLLPFCMDSDSQDKIYKMMDALS